MTKQLLITHEIYEKLAARAKEKGVTPDEYVVKIINEMIDREEFIRISIIAPKCLLRLMKDRQFFGTTKEAFLIKCLERGIGSELSELPPDEMKRLEKEYEADIDWAHFWLSINS